MAPRKTTGGGEGSKKAQGQARKAETANAKKAGKERELAKEEEKEWEKGSKDSSKKYVQTCSWFWVRGGWWGDLSMHRIHTWFADHEVEVSVAILANVSSFSREAAAAKAEEAARKKAEKAALLAEEEASLKTAKSGNAKTAVKKTRGLDLSQLDAPVGSSKASALNATGIDNALDALTLTSATNEAIDRHPERRFKAAYAQFEERRLDEMKDEKGLRRNQKIEQIRKEFEKHSDNPFNQVAGRYDMSKEELKLLREEERKKIEGRLEGT